MNSFIAGGRLSSLTMLDFTPKLKKPALNRWVELVEALSKGRLLDRRIAYSDGRAAPRAH
ncbi:MAG: hypothetical protein KJ606_06730 [Chloroflexi bacterium]|nr:hypothetical protein [Chloroflexota bacterium]